ncbi:NFACT family protein [Macrococcoides canis]|uniref:Rqc2 family fibronectin-binding protein n=1 Tax=Macrococcoides canis TaxID=1855823 RepID=UPI0020B81B6C|nr:NFACT RNA binding domain-containing protein [Macrococcus canis]UTH00987.1 NFACT family protein [Macrococcus canis]WBF52004.1 NFACT RNA binding domain-containing protein [Macrococcus canis]
MAFDGLFTHQMIEEISFLETARINKITQPDQYTVILTIRANRKNQKLMLSIHPNFARMQITNNQLDNPFEPPMFLRVLRKHIEGGIVERIEQMGNDRIVHFTINNTDEIGDRIKRHLYLEIMGKHSNIILTDDNNKILDSFKHLTPNTNSARTLMPGFNYEFPPTDKKTNPFTVDTISDKLDDTLAINKAVLRLLEGFSPLAVKEMLSMDADIDRAFTQFMQTIQTNAAMFTVDGKEDFYFRPVAHSTNIVTYQSLSEMLDIYYKDRAVRERVRNQTNDLSRHLSSLLQKNEKKLAKLVDELEQTKQMDEMNLYGELITSNMYQLKQGMDEFTTTNYYNEETVTIPLNPRKSPAENAQYYYKQYNRLKTRKAHAAEQIKATQDEIAYIETIQMQLDHISVDDIDDIRTELAEQNLIKKKHKTKQSKKQQSSIDHYLSRDGQEIVVGRNNLQNEYITHKLGRNNYLWFHTKDIPGSHVVILDNKPTDGTIEDAAMLAGYFSKAQGSSKIPVDYTEIKHVHKPSGAKPGFVTYTDQTTVMITPEEGYIEKLRNSYLNKEVPN